MTSRPMPIPGLNHALGETLDIVRDTVKDFTANEITPRAASIDQTNDFPGDLWSKMGELGLLGITVSEEFGGADLGYLAHVVVMEEISRGSASVGLSYAAHSNLCVNQIFRNGNEEQKRRYLPKLISGDNVGALAMSETEAGKLVQYADGADRFAGATYDPTAHYRASEVFDFFEREQFLLANPMRQ